MIKHVLALTMVAGSCFGANFLKENTTKLGPTDYYVGLWCNDDVARVVKSMNFTNLHVLYIDSHGGRGPSGTGYALTPHKEKTKKFYVYGLSDVAKVIGNEATNIHNFYLGACNESGTFNPQWVFKYFPNVTNITYVRRAVAYNATFLPAIVCTNNSGKIEKNLDGDKLTPFVSELYIKGQKKPYLTKIAGRETLHPTYQPVMGDIRNLLVENKQKP